MRWGRVFMEGAGARRHTSRARLRALKPFNSPRLEISLVMG